MARIQNRVGWIRRLTALGLVAIAAACTSCSRDNRVPVFPVTGQVLFAGKPATRALLVFHPVVENSLRPLGTVDEDGSFTLTTYEQGDGAPAGEYTVTVEWRRLATVDDDQRPPNKLPARYSNSKSSGIAVRVNEGANVLPPIQLTR
jgi:hypothetical protein